MNYADLASGNRKCRAFHKQLPGQTAQNRWMITDAPRNCGEIGGDHGTVVPVTKGTMTLALYPYGPTLRDWMSLMALVVRKLIIC